VLNYVLYLFLIFTV